GDDAPAAVGQDPRAGRERHDQRRPVATSVRRDLPDDGHHLHLSRSSIGEHVEDRRCAVDGSRAGADLFGSDTRRTRQRRGPVVALERRRRRRESAGVRAVIWASAGRRSAIALALVTVWAFATSCGGGRDTAGRAPDSRTLTVLAGS